MAVGLSPDRLLCNCRLAGHSAGYHCGTTEADHVRVGNPLQSEWSAVTLGNVSIFFSLAVPLFRYVSTTKITKSNKLDQSVDRDSVL